MFYFETGVLFAMQLSYFPPFLAPSLYWKRKRFVLHEIACKTAGTPSVFLLHAPQEIPHLHPTIARLELASDPFIEFSPIRPADRELSAWINFPPELE